MTPVSPFKDSGDVRSSMQRKHFHHTATRSTFQIHFTDHKYLNWFSNRRITGNISQTSCTSTNFFTPRWVSYSQCTICLRSEPHIRQTDNLLCHLETSRLFIPRAPRLVYLFSPPRQGVPDPLLAPLSSSCGAPNQHTSSLPKILDLTVAE